MSTTIFWHGTPADIPGEAIEPRTSFFEGIWLSSAQEVAAHYAGMGGWVHGFVPAPGARLLLATGHKANGRAFNYPDLATWQAVREFLETEERCEVDAFDALCPFKVEHGFVPPLGPEGQPSWEALFQDFCELWDTPNNVMGLIGVDGIVQGETAGQAMGDRRGVAMDRTHAALARALARAQDVPVLTLGVASAAALVPVCRIPARKAAEAFLAGHGMQRAEEADIARWLATPALGPSSVPRA